MEKVANGIMKTKYLHKNSTQLNSCRDCCEMYFWHKNTSYAVVTCEINLLQNYFSLCRHTPEIILFQRMETCLKLFQIHRLIAVHEYFPTCSLSLK